MTFKFVVPGKPRPKARPRLTYTGKAFTPRETLEYERSVREAYKESGGILFEGGVAATIRCYYEIPKSYNKARTADCKSNIVRPMGAQNGDCDNLAKSVLDGLNGIAFYDDKQVVELEVSKLWGEPARVEVLLRSV